MPKRPREFFNPYSVLQFTNDALDVFEDRDYDGAEPYLAFVLKHVPDNCPCRRPIPVATFRASMDEEDAERLALAILRWKTERHARKADRERMRQRVAKERDRLQELDALEKRLRRETEEL